MMKFGGEAAGFQVLGKQPYLVPCHKHRSSGLVLVLIVLVRLFGLLEGAFQDLMFMPQVGHRVCSCGYW